MPFSIHSKLKLPKFTFTAKYHNNQNWHIILSIGLSIPQDTDIIKCESSNRHPCYKCQGFPLYVWTSTLPWQRSVASKEEVVCHNCILYRISLD